MPSTPTRSSASRLVVELPASRHSARPSTSTSTPPRQRTSTPTQHAHSPHLSKADELAAEEAEEILGHVEGSARSRRHERLSRLRGQASREPERASVSGAAEDLEDKDDATSSAGDITLAATVDSAPADTNAATDRDASAEIAAVVGDAVGDETSGEEDAQKAGAESGDSSSAGTSSDSSQDDDWDASSATSESDSDDDDGDEQLEKLLQAARIAATAKAASAGNKGDGFTGGDEVVSFDQEGTEGDHRRRREAPIPDISITKLPKAHLSFSADGTAKAAEPRSALTGPSRPKSKKPSLQTPAPEMDDRPYERQLSKREKAAQPKKATASELWSTLPAPKADLLPQMKRDYQALSLANSLDPKRFMKGGSRSGKIPDNFAIGTLVEAPRHLQDTTLTREKQYRPGQLVQGLTRDEGTGSYAKRKYDDLQKTRMDNGRGRGWKKQKGWGRS